MTDDIVQILKSYVDFCIDGENVSVVSSSVQSYTYSTY